jgi:hypothetical protein
MATKSGWIDVFASGHVSLRAEQYSGKLHEGALPCYDAGSAKEARDLVVFACVLARDGTGYAVPGFAAESLASIDMAARRFKRSHDVMNQRRAKKAADGKS